MNKITFIICLLIVFLLSFKSGYACSCAFSSKPLSVSRSEAEIIFIGKVLNVKKISNKTDDENATPNRMVKFEITKIYKGLIASTKKITLKTREGGASCGLDDAPKKAIHVNNLTACTG